MNIHLSSKKCVACEGDVPPLNSEQIALYSGQVKNWGVSEDKKSLSKLFTFKDFKEAIAFIDKVGALAEEEGHHPDISLFGFKNVTLTLSTHAIGGLSENDFIVAAKVDVMF